MAQDDSQEKTEEPTARRMQQSREKGQIARSRELTTSVLMLVAASAVLLLGTSLADGLSRFFTNGLVIDREVIFDPNAMPRVLEQSILDMLDILTPFFAANFIAALLAPALIGGWVFAWKFKFEQMNPIKGLQKMFSVRALVELFKSLGKFVVVGAVAVMILWSERGEFIGLGREPMDQAFAHAASLIAWSFLLVSAATIIIAAIDVPFQIWQHTRQLRMTKQEVKDEHKDTEGKPEVKQRIRQKQMEFAQRRMMQDVPRADVIVTNPTHFAVALSYDEDSMGAPRVLAKGADVVAAQIRRIGTDSEVPQISAPPLARALYFTTDIGHEIPASLFRAVAQILAYVYQLKVARRRGGVVPKRPKDWLVPKDLVDKYGG